MNLPKISGALRSVDYTVLVTEPGAYHYAEGKGIRKLHAE